MDQEFGLNELTDLTLKATYPIEINGKVFEVGEVVARFDKIQLANFKEITSRTTANGGYDNRAHVVWEDPKEIQLNFTQGIFSMQQFALLSNANLIEISEGEEIVIGAHFSGESDENGEINIGRNKISDVFIYDKKTHEKIKPQSINYEEGVIVIEKPYVDVEIDYNFIYLNQASQYSIGQKMIKGYLQLEGKSRVKDDITGKTHTAILRIPRLKLESDLSKRLGREATPMLANFSAIGLPTGERGSKKIMELLILSDDIDADL